MVRVVFHVVRCRPTHKRVRLARTGLKRPNKSVLLSTKVRTSLRGRQKWAVRENQGRDSIVPLLRSPTGTAMRAVQRHSAGRNLFIPCMPSARQFPLSSMGNNRARRSFRAACPDVQLHRARTQEDSDCNGRCVHAQAAGKNVVRVWWPWEGVPSTLRDG